MSHVKTSLVQAVLQTASRTFSRRPVTPTSSVASKKFSLSHDEFKDSLADLKRLLNGLRACDLGLERSKILSTNGQRGPGDVEPEPEAPVTYIKILEDNDVSIGIFVVRSGCRIPLHNHPQMHGMLKVVHGTFDVAIYSKKKLQNGLRLADLADDIPQPLKEHQSLLQQGLVFPAEKRLLKSVNPETEPLTLTPEDNNYHEIITVGEGHAAFFDILAPPYNRDDFEDDQEVRECHFFNELKFGNNNIHPENRNEVWIQRIHSPNDYYCDTEPFLGPQT